MKSMLLGLLTAAGDVKYRETVASPRDFLCPFFICSKTTIQWSEALRRKPERKGKRIEISGWRWWWEKRRGGSWRRGDLRYGNFFLTLMIMLLSLNLFILGIFRLMEPFNCILEKLKHWNFSLSCITSPTRIIPYWWHYAVFRPTFL